MFQLCSNGKSRVDCLQAFRRLYFLSGYLRGKPGEYPEGIRFVLTGERLVPWKQISWIHGGKSQTVLSFIRYRDRPSYRPRTYLTSEHFIIRDKN